MYIDTYRYIYLHILTHTLYHTHSPHIYPFTAPPLHLINPQTQVKISTRARCTEEVLLQHEKAFSERHAHTRWAMGWLWLVGSLKL